MSNDGIVKERVELVEPEDLQRSAGASADHEEAEDWDRLLRESYERARSSGEIGPEVTLQQWGTPPGTNETHEDFLQSLRESYAEAKSGSVISVEAAFAQLRAELGMAPKPDESL